MFLLKQTLCMVKTILKIKMITLEKKMCILYTKRTTACFYWNKKLWAMHPSYGIKNLNKLCSAQVLPDSYCMDTDPSPPSKVKRWVRQTILFSRQNKSIEGGVGLEISRNTRASRCLWNYSRMYSSTQKRRKCLSVSNTVMYQQNWRKLTYSVCCTYQMLERRPIVNWMSGIVPRFVRTDYETLNRTLLFNNYR
jgi:hypothetical protein